MGITYIFVFLLTFWAIINYSYYQSVRHLSNAQKLLEEVELINDQNFIKAHKTFSDWCLSNGFEHNKYFLFHGVINGPALMCSAWWSDSTKTWALLYVSKIKNNIDFCTIFENNIDLTTASSKDALSLPKPPDSYIQSFTKISHDDQYTYHKDVVSDIGQAHQVSVNAEKQDLFMLITESIARQRDYIKTLPFWYLRGTYWYFASRNLNVNNRVQL
ncbi:hypothetical protein [Marinicella gelatinilytica]|uniref:hypothetical protein n=1 Tax=Marinicella gelatinilytica TaxID=2996017 RepID=UPI002260C293|nr:hypothetical protein [Marinicella gelatinilytica]MCX7545802.1 hypothetical protein [Marinicella gelatinilytica]